MREKNEIKFKKAPCPSYGFSDWVYDPSHARDRQPRIKNPSNFKPADKNSKTQFGAGPKPDKPQPELPLHNCQFGPYRGGHNVLFLRNSLH